MKKNIGKYIAIVLGIICIILIITLIYIKVSSVNAQSSDRDLKSKIIEEIAYIDSNIIDIMNQFNNIYLTKYKVYTKEVNDPSSESSESSQSGSQGSDQSSSQEQNSSNQSSGESQSNQSQSGESQSSETNQSNTTTVSSLAPNNTLEESSSKEIDWTAISFAFENLYSSWPTINLDLQKQGIANELINSFSSSMDGAIQSIKNREKENTLINLYNMYLNLPKYLSSINADNYTLSLYYTKSYILNAYVLVSTGDKWNDITSCVSEAKDNFSSIISTSDKSQEEKSALEKVYVIIENLERISQINDKDIFYMGYKNVMQEIENL